MMSQTGKATPSHAGDAAWMVGYLSDFVKQNEKNAKHQYQNEV